MEDARHDPTLLPTDLPVPTDDGAANHLRGTELTSLELPATDGTRVDLATLRGRTVLYAYPRMGEPGKDPLVADWDAIPGARGCTPESCGFRDHHADLAAAGSRVFGLSTQDSDYQREAVDRLRLPFPLLSDADLRLTSALRLPTFDAGGHTLLRRLTMVVDDGAISHVWYPVFPPDGHAAEVLTFLRAQPA